jgi:hypothetical protein
VTAVTRDCAPNVLRAPTLRHTVSTAAHFAWRLPPKTIVALRQLTVLCTCEGCIFVQPVCKKYHLENNLPRELNVTVEVF